LQEHDSTVVMSTHDVDLARRRADEVAAIRDLLAVLPARPGVPT
jgi:cobalt/nickel transport system ATP-binding protein